MNNKGGESRYLYIRKSVARLGLYILTVSHIGMFIIGAKFGNKDTSNTIAANGFKIELLRTVPRSERLIGFQPISKKVISLVAKAKKEVYVAAYGLTHEGIIGALEDAANRGVKVRLALDKQYVKDLQTRIRRLYFSKSKNIEIYAINLPGHGIAHDKFVVIDPIDNNEAVVITGSYNFTFNADTNNRENALIIKSDFVAKAYKRYWVDGIYSSNAQLLKGENKTTHLWTAMEESAAVDEEPDFTKSVQDKCNSASELVYCIFSTMPTDRIISSLLQAKAKGIDVRIVVSKNILDHMIAKVGSNIPVKSHFTAKSNSIIIDKEVFKLNHNSFKPASSSKGFTKFVDEWSRI